MSKYLLSLLKVSVFVCFVFHPAIDQVNAQESVNALNVKTMPLSEDDQTALELGRKVIKLNEAIADPNAKGSMDAVVGLGGDQRYYTMVRGWLAQQLMGDMSIQEASKEQTPYEIRDRIDFIRKAMLLIDSPR